MNRFILRLVITLTLIPMAMVALAQEPSAPAPAATASAAAATVPAASVEGTMWEGTDSQGDFAQYTFLKGGQLRVRSANLLGKLETAEGKGDTWSQDGSTIRFKVNDFVTYVGTLDDDRIRGDATTVKGSHWTWDVKQTTKVAKKLPNPRSPNATGPAQLIEITLADDRSYVWNGRSWKADELRGELYRLSREHPIDEVRLSVREGAMSVAHAIAINQMALVVGAKATFLVDGKPLEVKLH